MSKIKVMSEILANKIAAGEVVERIANVVKELVENSIDAKSTNIKIELIDAGKTLIRVIDNGIGMDEEDAKVAFFRHATSKIYKDDDLFFINTLGFRGEALPSIAAVSECVMETFDGEASTLIHIKGGEVIEVGIAPKRQGTCITVTNLFYNTPARLKYLKSEPTELANITSYIEKLALSYPNISLYLSNNGRTVIRTSASGNLLKTIHEIYGLEVSSNMLEIKASNDDYDINGYISKPIIQRKTRNYINTIINGRIVKNFELNKIINDSYYTYKPDSTYPIIVINIETDPTLIDVNIHPTKQDIKFSKLDSLKELLQSAIKNALYDSLLIPNIENKDTEEIDNKDESADDDFLDLLPKTLFIQDGEKIESKLTMPSISQTKEEEKNEEQKVLDFGNKKNEKIKSLTFYPIGIALGTYIIAENDEGVYLIDQHAAVERINYEKVLKGLIKNEKISLLVPITFELSKSDMTTLQEHMDILNNMGFEIEEFGINTIKVNEHPTWIKEGYEKDTIRTIFDLLIDEKNFNILKFNDKVAATIACKKSLKGNTRITLELASEILNNLVLCDNPYNCPHGRPTIIKFTKYELEKMFKRAM